MKRVAASQPGPPCCSGQCGAIQPRSASVFAQSRAAWLTPARGWRRELVVLPALWALGEWFRGWVLSGFPWLSAGYSQIDSPMAGLAPVIGIYGLGLLLALSAGLLLRLLDGPWPSRVVAAAAGVLLWGTAAAAATVEWTRSEGEPLRVAIIQGNVSQDRKWLPEERWPTIRLYTEHTRALWDDADLIVWPEAALPVLYHQIRHSVLEPLGEEAREHGTEVIMGILTQDQAEGHYHNTILRLAESPQFYRKRKLVPFGEFFPVPNFVREWMRLMNLPYTDFQRGEKMQDPIEVFGHKIGASICYEDVFPRQVNRPLPQARMLVNVSNDAWFGDSIAPHQHLEIARMRSLETGREMIRATNTGISAFIGHRGQVRDTYPQFRTGVLQGEVQPREGTTPYVLLGNWPVVLGALLMLGFGGGRRWLDAVRSFAPRITP
jgi:apolipoprotein N-acyltransferase